MFVIGFGVGISIIEEDLIYDEDGLAVYAELFVMGFGNVCLGDVIDLAGGISIIELETPPIFLGGWLDVSGGFRVGCERSLV